MNAESAAGSGGASRITRVDSHDRHEVLHMWRGGSAPDVAHARRPDTRGSAALAAHHAMDGLVHAEVIPRLLDAHTQVAHEKRGATGFRSGSNSAEVAAFTRVLMAPEESAGDAFIDALLDAGRDEHAIFLDLFTPAARGLGRMWELDTASFSEVTIGLLRLHRMLRKLSAQKGIPRYVPRADMRVLLSAYPGETHIYGVRMVGEFFRHAGWVVSDEPQPSAAVLIESVASEWFAVIGLSLSSDVRVADITALVVRLRDASCNRHVGIMVGGDLFNRRPELAGLVGADLTACDGVAAVAEAERWREAVALPYSMNSA